MSLWEFRQATDGWARAQGGEEKPVAPTNDEHDALMAKYS